MVVLRLAQMKLEVTPALVVLVIVWQVMDMDVWISMNVLKALMAVIILVQILLGAIPATVTQGTVWQVIGKYVVVS